MPSLSLLTAPPGGGVTHGQPGVIRLPSPGAASFGAPIGEGATEFGQALFNASRKLQDQQDELESIKLAGDLDLQANAIHQQVLADPTLQPKEMPAKYRELYGDAAKQLMDQTQSPAVRRALELHQARQLPHALINLQTDSLKQQADKNDQLLLQTMQDRANLVAQSREPAYRDYYMKEVKDLLDRSVQRGIKAPDVAEKQWQGFQQDVLQKQMDYLRMTNRHDLYELNLKGAFNNLDIVKRTEILAKANEDDRREQAKNEKAFEHVQTLVETNWTQNALKGQLSADQLERAENGLDPLIAPEIARQFRFLNDHPMPSEEDDLEARTIMQIYHGRTLGRPQIAWARKQLTNLAKSRPAPSKLIDQALNELQNDEIRLRTVEASELQAGMKFVEDEVKSQTPPDLPMGGMMGRMQKNKAEAESAEDRAKLRRGMKPEDVIKQRLEQRKKEAESVPERDKGVLDLLK